MWANVLKDRLRKGNLLVRIGQCFQGQIQKWKSAWWCHPQRQSQKGELFGFAQKHREIATPLTSRTDRHRKDNLMAPRCAARAPWTEPEREINLVFPREWHQISRPAIKEEPEKGIYMLVSASRPQSKGQSQKELFACQCPLRHCQVSEPCLESRARKGRN